MEWKTGKCFKCGNFFKASWYTDLCPVCNVRKKQPYYYNIEVRCGFCPHIQRMRQFHYQQGFICSVCTNLNRIPMLSIKSGRIENMEKEFKKSYPVTIKENRGVIYDDTLMEFLKGNKKACPIKAKDSDGKYVTIGWINNWTKKTE